MLNLIAARCHDTAKAKGWWPETTWISDLIMQKLLMIHSEVSEATEAFRVKDDYGVADELADVIIRVLDLSAAMDIDIEKHLKRKMKYNETRSFRHGDKLC